MTTATIISIITKELLNPTLELTRQFLRILEVKYENDIPKVAKIEIDQSKNQGEKQLTIYSKNPIDKEKSRRVEFRIITTSEILVQKVIEHLPFTLEHFIYLLR